MEAVLSKNPISVKLSKDSLEVLDLAINSFKEAGEYPMAASLDRKKYGKLKRRRSRKN